MLNMVPSFFFLSLPLSLAMVAQSAIARNTYWKLGEVGRAAGSAAPVTSALVPAIGRWRRYEHQLQPMPEELQKQGVDLD